ncbi:MAG: MBL fold metallo-hydrolase [Lachnospiraceae bacterium]|nr:MBL fold metallo-hydrolase [Lachnospiraceae bacterium]
MEELCQNVFQQTIKYPGQHSIPRNLLVVKQPGRSLMVDTSTRCEQDLEFVDRMLKDLEISCENLDIFITHDHPDHTGLVATLAARGARVFMNPEEVRRRTDLLHCYLSDEQTRVESLRTVGVTESDTPEVYRAVMDYTSRAYRELGPQKDFDFIPAPPGTILEYGEFHFEVISLKGHTYGQCGLYEPAKRLLFCGDQMLVGIVPNVGSQQKNLGMLKSYLETLDQMKHKYKDCHYFPAHYGPIEDIEKEANRIIFSYMDKCAIMKRVLEEQGTWMTTRDVGVRAYGRSSGPPDYRHFFSCTMIWIKTFSCLEYLYGEGFIERTERNGILYWCANM